MPFAFFFALFVFLPIHQFRDLLIHQFRDLLIMPLIEGRSTGAEVHVEIDQRATKRHIFRRPKLHPSATPGQDDLIKPRIGPREIAVDGAEELTGACVERETVIVLHIINQQPGHRAQRRHTSRQIAFQTIQHQQCVIASRTGC